MVGKVVKVGKDRFTKVLDKKLDREEILNKGTLRLTFRQLSLPISSPFFSQPSLPTSSLSLFRLIKCQ